MGGTGSYKVQAAVRTVPGWWSAWLTWDIMLFTFAVCFGFLPEAGRGNRYRFIKTCRIFLASHLFSSFQSDVGEVVHPSIRQQAVRVCSHVEPSCHNLCVIHTCEFTCRMYAWKWEHGSRFWPVGRCEVLQFALWWERWKMAGLSRTCWIRCSLDAAVISVPVARK